MSHTVTVQVEFRNRAALAAAVAALGGRVVGEGAHQLYSSQETGFAFQLPGWRYPIVVRGDGSIAYDDYHGAWGKVADLEALKARYAIEAAAAECERLGWLYERQETGLLVYHPDGGTLTITAGGEVDASGFTGSSCAEATAPLEAALGRTVDSTRKSEYYETARLRAALREEV